MTDKQDVPGDLFLGYMADLLELRKERTAAKNLREWIDAHPARYTPDPELAKVTAERDEARNIVRDIHWMAARYAEGRQSYAVGMFNDAVRKAYDGGWLTYLPDPGHTPQYATNGTSPEWKSLTDLLYAAERERDEARETARKLNREKQQLESLNADARRMVAEVPGTGGSYAQHFLRAYRAFAAEKERAQVAESLLASRTTVIEAAIEAMGAANRLLMALRLGKSIHNERTPTRPVGGPLWDEIPDVVSTGEARIAQLRSLIAGKDEITTVDLLSELLACVWRPNPYDHSRIDIAPGKHHKFQALVERAVTAKGAKLPSRALPKNTLIAGKETDV